MEQQYKIIKPIEMIAYKCPKCNRFFTDKDEATKHSNIPLDTPLPLGLVFFSAGSPVLVNGEFKKAYTIVGDIGKLVTGEPLLFWAMRPVPHTFDYLVFEHVAETGKYEGRPYHYINSKDTKELISCGIYRLLTPEEFNAFSEKYFNVKKIQIQKKSSPNPWVIDKLIRTTPKLEKLVEEHEEYLRKIHKIE